MRGLVNRALFENELEYSRLSSDRVQNLHFESRVRFDGGCDTQDARVEGLELTLGVALQRGFTPLFMAACGGHLEGEGR